MGFRGFINEALLVVLLLYFEPEAVESETSPSSQRRASELKTLPDIFTSNMKHILPKQITGIGSL